MDVLGLGGRLRCDLLADSVWASKASSTNLTEARRGIAAAVSIANEPMPSQPGRTTWETRTRGFENQVGFAFAHRLETRIPLAIAAPRF